MASNQPPSWSVHLLSLLRIVSAFLLIAHGTQKLFNFPAANPLPVAWQSLPAAAGVIETLGGFLLLIGLFTRPVAFILSGEMAAAYFLIHSPLGFWPLLNMGELAALNCFIFLYIAAAGGGPLSVDRMRR